MPGEFDWITTPTWEVSEILRHPYEGFLADVEWNDVWWPSWGPRPQTPLERASRLADVMAEAPKLIPLSFPRYLPETPSENGNPVFSVFQTDVIYAGVDLADWIVRHEGGAGPAIDRTNSRPPKQIPFWSLAVDIDWTGR